MKEIFEKIEINEQEVLFTNERIDRSQLPQGYYAYDIRHDDEGEPSTIEQNVMCNHYGTILTKVQIEMTEGDYTPISDINFIGEEVEV